MAGSACSHGSAVQKDTGGCQLKNQVYASLLALCMASAFATPADTVYCGGTILTMACDPPQTVAQLEAAAKAGKTVFRAEKRWSD